MDVRKDMYYTTLARRWRPQSFDRVVGQEHVTRVLKNALSQGRIGHAYLFAGSRGVGKTTVARILARALNCEKGPTPYPCNTCLPCKDILKGTSVDVIEIDGASNTGVDDVREIRENVRYLPSGRYRVYIIDEVHMLSTNAFNALLKTLEEPPAHAVFIFATTEPHKIPPTILSRCQRFDFKRLPTKRIKDTLKEIAVAEGIEAEDKALLLIAREAEGSMRDAQVMLDQILASTDGRVCERDVVDLLGLLDRELLNSLGEAILLKDGEGCVRILRKIQDFGYDERRLWQELIALFRDLFLLRLTGDTEGMVELSEDEAGPWRERLESFSLEDIQWILQSLSKGYEELSRSFSPHLALEITLLRITTMPPLSDIRSLMERIEEVLGGGEGLKDAGRLSAHPTAGCEPLKKETREGPVEKDLLGFIKKKSVPLYTHFEFATSLRLEGETLFIEIPKGIHQEYLQEKREDIERACREFFKKQIRVVIRGVKGNGGMDREGNEEDPYIKDVLEIFGGRVYKDIKLRRV